MIAPTQAPPLRGIVIREEGATLVVQATEHDVQRFARQRRSAEVDVAAATLAVVLGGRPVVDPLEELGRARTPSDVGVLRMSDYLYDAEGRPVARLMEVQAHVEHYDVTSFGDAHQQYVRGHHRVSIRAEGLPGVTMV